MSRAIASGLLAVFLVACGGTPPPPKQGVLDRDLGAWKYRRSQRLLDVEVWVPKNKAVAFTASYVYGQALKRGRVEDRDVVSAFVTRYQRHAGVKRALVKFARRLAQESGYTVDEDKLGGARVFIVSGHGEKWALWVAKQHVIKIGGPAIDQVPEALIEDYADRYPSRLESGLLEGPLPPGDDGPREDKDDEPYDPDNPTPDWDRYDSKDSSPPKSKKKK